MNDWERQHRMAQRYKEQYPPGTRIVLNHMDDPYSPIPEGMRGTVRHVDDMGTLHMNWDNGRALGVVPGEDSFRKLTEEELKEEQRLAAEEYQDQQDDQMQEQTMLRNLLGLLCITAKQPGNGCRWSIESKLGTLANSKFILGIFHLYSVPSTNDITTIK